MERLSAPAAGLIPRPSGLSYPPLPTLPLTPWSKEKKQPNLRDYIHPNVASQTQCHELATNLFFRVTEWALLRHKTAYSSICAEYWLCLPSPERIRCFNIKSACRLEVWRTWSQWHPGLQLCGQPRGRTRLDNGATVTVCAYSAALVTISAYLARPALLFSSSLTSTYFLLLPRRESHWRNT